MNHAASLPLLRRRPRPGRVLLALAVAALLLAVTTACSGDDAETLTVYSGRSEQLIGPLLQRFTDETGIEVEVKYGDSAELALLIEQEGDRSPADVFISQSPGATSYVAVLGRLQALPTEILDRVPTGERAADGTWVGLTGRVRVLVYDADRVDPATIPPSVLDLTDPAFRGQVAVAPSNGSFQDFVSAMRAELGDDVAQDWLDGMAANDAPAYANNVAIVEAVGRGEVPMGLVNHYYNERAQAEDPGLESENHFFPDGDVGSLLIVAAGGVLGTSDSAETAERLLAFLLSEPAQQYFADETFEYPLVAEVPAPADLPPLASLDVDTVDFDQLGGDLAGTIEMIQQSGLDD
jgi:iron(III) transport system substrate-binding protein